MLWYIEKGMKFQILQLFASCVPIFMWDLSLCFPINKKENSNNHLIGYYD